MSSLLKIRAERDQMSAIERRIADFLLENAHLLRDYSSQQLADALGVSQSSVVKFSQKLGFKGYPDLKFSIGEAIVRDDVAALAAAGGAQPAARGALASDLWRAKSHAEEETRVINPPDTIHEIAMAIDRAGKVFCIGAGEDDLFARSFALRLALTGVLAVHQPDAALMGVSLGAASKGDVLIAFSEQGRPASLHPLCKQMRERRGRTISVTRHTANPLRAQADLCLLISAHDDRAHIEPLLYRAALEHLLDLVFVSLCEHGESRMKRLSAALERLRTQ